MLEGMSMAFLDIDDGHALSSAYVIDPAKAALGVADALIPGPSASQCPSRSQPSRVRAAAQAGLRQHIRRVQIAPTPEPGADAQARATIERIALACGPIVASPPSPTPTVTHRSHTRHGLGACAPEGPAGAAERARARHGRRGLLRLPTGRAELLLRRRHRAGALAPRPAICVY